jgi:hypothetical protein
LAAFEELEKAAWYLLHTSEGRYYFERKENSDLAAAKTRSRRTPTTPGGTSSRHRLLADMFKGQLASPSMDDCPAASRRREDAAEKRASRPRASGGEPESKDPPDEVQRFFDGLCQKNY